jgi:hypothetical protein
MADKFVETGDVFLWRSKPEWWKLQRSLIVNSGMKGVSLRTSLEEYHALLDKTKDEMLESGISVQDIFQHPGWVKRELQESRMPLTQRNISIILSDPLGIDRKGFPGVETSTRPSGQISNLKTFRS